MEYEKIGEHTIKKFELVSKYAEGWARKILGYGKSKGLVYIDCMCNCGKYYDSEGNVVEGTALRVAKYINAINEKHKKNSILFFNDIDKEKIECLKSELETLNLRYVKYYCFNTDANALLRIISEQDFDKHNTLLFYDPYNADIDWDALEPFYNMWGEVIINHMISDPIRGAKMAHKPDKIAKYERTYRQGIDEIIKISNQPNNREELEKRISSIINSCVYDEKSYYIASFPFYIKTNQLVYNLIYFSWNRNGIVLFKRTAWDVFGGQSALKHRVASSVTGQLCLDFDNGKIKEEAQRGVYTVYDIAKYVYEKYKGKGEVSFNDIYIVLEKHPIFPSDGYKNDLREILKESFGVKIKKASAVFED